MSALPDNHPSWKELAKPVIAWLREGPRTWDEINQFGAENRIFQSTMMNIIAWLENRKLAYGVYEDGVVVWRLRGCRPAARKKLPDVPVDEEPKEHRQDEHRDAGEKRPPNEEQNGNPKRRQKRESRQNPRKSKPERLHGRSL